MRQEQDNWGELGALAFYHKRTLMPLIMRKDTLLQMKTLVINMNPYNREDPVEVEAVKSDKRELLWLVDRIAS